MTPKLSMGSHEDPPIGCMFFGPKRTMSKKTVFSGCLPNFGAYPIGEVPNFYSKR